MLVAGIAQTSLMFSYLTCLPAVSSEPTTVHKGTLDPMQNLSVEPTELRGSGFMYYGLFQIIFFVQKRVINFYVKANNR